MPTVANPAVQEASSQVGFRMRNRGHVEHDWPVGAHRGGGVAGEDVPEPSPRAQRDQGGLEVFGDFLVAGVAAAVQGHLAHLVRSLPDHREQVDQSGGAGVVGVQPGQGPGQDRLLADVRWGFAQDRDQ